MSAKPVQIMSDEELVDAFADLAFQQHDTLETDDADRYNALCERMKPIEAELKLRGNASYARLERLLAHSNITVRLETARRLMKTTPAKARAVLQQIQKSGRFPHVGDAGMLLRRYASQR